MIKFIFSFAVFAFALLGRCEDFIRATSFPNGMDCLQVAVKTYNLPDQKEILLVGVSHVGSQKYFEGLQKILNVADVVLYEGVDGEKYALEFAKHEQPPERSQMQANLARALGLVFQLHHIDYRPEHFINSDVTSQQLFALFDGEEMPESAPVAKADMERMLENMEEASATGQAAAAALDFLEVRPGWGRAMRWAMVKMLGTVSGNISDYPGLPDHMKTMMNVIIEKRNEVVMADIHDQVELRAPGESIAVFYGAAHMHDFEERIVKELRAELVETEWRNAFCGNLQTSGLNVIEKKMVSLFVNQQVGMMKVISAPVESEE